MKRFFKSIYDKVRARVEGGIAGGAIAAVITSILNGADTTDLSPSQQAVITLITSSIVGTLNMYRRPETHEPVRPHRKLPEPPGA